MPVLGARPVNQARACSSSDCRGASPWPMSMRCMQFALGRRAKAAEQQGPASELPPSSSSPAKPPSRPLPAAQHPRAAPQARSSALSMPGRAQQPALTAGAAGAAGRQSHDRRLAAEIDAENAQTVHAMGPEEARPHRSTPRASFVNDAVTPC